MRTPSLVNKLCVLELDSDRGGLDKLHVLPAGMQNKHQSSIWTSDYWWFLVLVSLGGATIFAL